MCIYMYNECATLNQNLHYYLWSMILWSMIWILVSLRIMCALAHATPTELQNGRPKPCTWIFAPNGQFLFRCMAWIRGLVGACYCAHHSYMDWVNKILLASEGRQPAKLTLLLFLADAPAPNSGFAPCNGTKIVRWARKSKCRPFGAHFAAPWVPGAQARTWCAAIQKFRLIVQILI